MSKLHWSKEDIDIVLHVCNTAIDNGLPKAAEGTYKSLMRLYLKGNNGEVDIDEPVAMIEGLEAVYDRLHPLMREFNRLLREHEALQHSNDKLARENEMLRAKVDLLDQRLDAANQGWY